MRPGIDTMVQLLYISPMDTDTAQGQFNDFDTLFHRIVNKINRMEKKPRHFGTDTLLYPSEIHTIDAIGSHPGINMTRLATLQGITKGAISQVVRKLVERKMVIRMKDETSDRDVLLMLSPQGKTAFEHHKDFHSQVDPNLLQIIQDADESQIQFIDTLLRAIDKFCDRRMEETP